MMMRSLLLTAALLALLFPGGAPVAADLDAGLKKCAAVSDSLRRLSGRQYW